MKNKIYGKLFEFCDPKTWTKTYDHDEDTLYTSRFYSAYELRLH